jgi:hypothetical protein
MGMPPAIAGTPRKALSEIAHDDARIWKKSVEIAARDIAEIRH